jgi:hypothetical protein
VKDFFFVVNHHPQALGFVVPVFMPSEPRRNAQIDFKNSLCNGPDSEIIIVIGKIVDKLPDRLGSASFVVQNDLEFLVVLFVNTG